MSSYSASRLGDNSRESIADAFVFLCSPLGAKINGQILNSDHGSGIRNRL